MHSTIYQDPEGCVARADFCLLYKAKERWLDAGLPVKEDHNIILLMTKIWKDFVDQKKHLTRLTEEKKARLRASWSGTLNLAPDRWEALIRADWHTTAAQHNTKINILEDYIGLDASRYYERTSSCFVCILISRSILVSPESDMVRRARSQTAGLRREERNAPGSSTGSRGRSRSRVRSRSRSPELRQEAAGRESGGSAGGGRAAAHRAIDRV